ncbi:MAG: hypothetical protein JXR70_18600 [Spirochaetales bacterium]|nr:hypothetical protein [Spirochaetales bacterium]
MVYLINPPLTKATEPHSGLAKLCGSLKANGYIAKVLDFNLEAQLDLISRNMDVKEKKVSQALSRVRKNLGTLRSLEIYNHPQKYERLVKEINRVLSLTKEDVFLSLQNIEYPGLASHRSEDLKRVYENPKLDFFYDFYSRILPPLIERDKPLAMGISMVYLNQALSVFGLLGFLNQYYPGIKIIVGGSLVECWEPLPGFDKLKAHCTQVSWVSGAGEEPLLRILDYRDKNILQGSPDYSDVRELPYFAPGFILPYSLSVGCFYKKCRFCPECLNPQSYWTQSFANARIELEQLVEKNKPALIHFIDNALSLAHLRGLAEYDLCVPWYGYSRFLPQLTDLDFVKALAKNRCAMLQLGLESGSQSVLDRLGKGIKLEQAATILENLKKAGILSFVYLLFGTPFDGEKEAEETLKLVKELAPYIDFLNLSIFYLPHEFVHDFQVEHNQFSEGDLSLYTDFKHPENWGRRAVRDFLTKRFKKEPEIKSILSRRPPYFTSNHGAFFNTRLFSVSGAKLGYGK